MSRRLGGAEPKPRESRGASVDIRCGEVEQGLITAVEELAPGGNTPIAAEQVTDKRNAILGKKNKKSTERGDRVA